MYIREFHDYINTEDRYYAVESFQEFLEHLDLSNGETSLKLANIYFHQVADRYMMEDL